jgi:hypothetical protein
VEVILYDRNATVHGTGQDAALHVCMYVCIYQGRAANGPSTATIPDLLCFPLYLAPY